MVRLVLSTARPTLLPVLLPRLAGMAIFALAPRSAAAFHPWAKWSAGVAALARGTALRRINPARLPMVHECCKPAELGLPRRMRVTLALPATQLRAIWACLAALVTVPRVPQ